MIHYC